MAWLSGLAARAGDGRSSSSGLLAWGRRRVEHALARMLGPLVIGETAAIFSDLSTVRGRFSAIARQAEALLLGAETRFVIVAAPTGAARADATYIARRIRKLGRPPAALILNRADVGPPPWVATLLAADPSEAVRAATEELEIERAHRTAAADRAAEALAAQCSGISQLRLPAIEAVSPRDIVRALADELAPALGLLAGRTAAENARRS